MNSLDGLTLAQLRYFAAVAAGDTFADAAAVLGISQSALSQGIARLETVTGARLLERDGRRRRVTNAGQLVADYARRVLGESETLAGDLETGRSGVRGRLRVGLIDAAALYLFNDRIAIFRDSHEAVEISVAVAGSDELEHALADFRLDVAVMVGPAKRTDSTHLVSEPMHIYGREPVDETSTWALYPAGSRTRAAIDEGLEAAGIVPNVTVESGNPAVLRELATLTGSLTVLPAGVAGEFDPIVTNVAQRDVLLARRSGSDSSALVQRFSEAMTSAGEVTRPAAR